MSYATDKTIKTRIREAVKYHLGRITLGNGYKIAVEGVLDDPPANLSEVVNHPTIIPVWDSTVLLLETNVDECFESLIALYVFVQAQSDVSLTIEQTEADILRCFGTNYQLPDENGTPLAQRVQFVSSVPFGRVDSKPSAGTKMVFKITWSHKASDPTIIGSAL